MAKVEEHCADCARELGEPFQDVNTWLDELFDSIGPDHRDVRHNERGVEKVRKMFGEKAAQAAIIHIKRDCHGVVPKVDGAFQLRLAMKPHIAEAFDLEYPLTH